MSNITVWQHKKTKNKYIITDKVDLKFFGRWKPAVIYQSIDISKVDGSLTMKTNKYCRVAEDFKKKFMGVGHIDTGGEKKEEEESTSNG